MSAPSALAASCVDRTDMHLILLPGMDGTGELFAPLVSALPAWIRPRVIAYPPDRAMTYAQLVELVMPQLPADSPFVILGESFSGPVAIAVAHRRPLHLAGVILCVTFARSTRPKMPRIPLPAFAANWGPAFTEWSLRVSRAAWVWRLLLGRDFTTERHRMIQGAVDRNTPDVLAGRIREMSTVDVTRELAEIEVPVLYLRASQDRIVPRQAGDQIASANPAVRMQDLDGSHFLLQAHALEAAKIIAAFCRAPGSG
jgi:pimeloyl-ACP methyl ester carboxylesterase